ncbi:hypothetical protein ACWPMX_13045 [Tsuneonella sp. HG094]
MSNPFTFAYIERQYRAALDAGYTVVNCRDYVALRASGQVPERTLVNRIDIDVSVKKAERLGEIYRRLAIPATFFVRLHAREYNPFDFDNYRILKGLAADGHELGYHSEIEDQAAIWGEDAEQCLRRDLSVMETMFGHSVVGIASHGGMTGINNLDFWRDREAGEFGALYEAYEENGGFDLFNRSLYVTDSEWTRWKAYRDGKRIDGDQRSLAEHLEDAPPLVYLLIHPETYFDRHVYE